MKKLYILLFLSIIYDWNVNAQSPAWQWAKSAGGDENDPSNGIAIDANGNVLITGFFRSDSISFGTTVLTNTDTTNDDIFVAKYDASGNVLWAKSAGGTGIDNSIDISTDGSGNVFVTGFFESDTLIFGTDTLIKVGSIFDSDIFVAKYDASGNILWAKSAGGIKHDGGSKISTDVSGNILVTGSFNSPSITFGTVTLTNVGLLYSADMFVVKYDASGNVLWAKSAGGASYDNTWGICTDANENVLVTGHFLSSSITFGTTVLSNTDSTRYDFFIVKYSALGNVLWAKSTGGAANEVDFGISTDGNGNAMVIGEFYSDSVSFGTTVLMNTGPGNSDLFITKYDSSGNVLWAKSAGGPGHDRWPAISSDVGGNILVSAFFDSDSLTFGTVVLTNTDAGSTDIFIAKYDASGNVVWAKSVGGTSYDFSYDICTDVSGNVFLTGYFDSDSIAFGTDTLINISAGSLDLFIAKLDSTVFNSIAEENDLLNPATVFPNPCNGQFQITSSIKMDEIKITNLTGQIIYQSKPKENNLSIQLDEAGIYFIRVTMKDQIVTKKIMVSR